MSAFRSTQTQYESINGDIAISGRHFVITIVAPAAPELRKLLERLRGKTFLRNPYEIYLLVVELISLKSEETRQHWNRTEFSCNRET